MAGDGVGIFFVLSGFLITSLMLQEREATGFVSLFNFYLRRTFRILPPLYVYLVFYLVFCFAMGLAVNWRAICSAGLFYLDYSPQSYFWATQHTWSLSIEEQFYLIWPGLFLLAFHFGGKPAAAKVAVGLIVFSPISRIVTKFIHLQVFHNRETYMLHTRLDALMCGALVALVAGEPWFERIYRGFAKVWWLAPLYTLLLGTLLNWRFGFAYTYTLGYTVDSFSIAFFILWAARNPQSWTGKLLNMKWMVGAGVLSYSAYIWQTFFIFYDQHAKIPGWLCLMPVRVLLIWAVAWLSYALVEQPSLKLRKKVQRFWERQSSSLMPPPQMANTSAILATRNHHD